MRGNPRDRFVIAMRRQHAAEIRRLFREDGIHDVATFNREVWRLASRVLVRGEDRTKGIFDLEMTEEVANDLSMALEAGAVEFHGNAVWGSATRVFGTRHPNDDARLESIREAVRIVNEDESTAREVYDGLMSVTGFGRNIASGLTMLFFPEEFPLYNSRMVSALGKLGYPSPRSIDEAVKRTTELRDELGAADFIELDWFLYLVDTGVVVLDGERSGPSSTFPQSPPAAVRDDLNVILYGPPGTGKTYETTRRAVEIVDGSAPDDREELVERYRELRDQKRLGFVTFHQAFSYEEFVEGLRPRLMDQGDEEPDGQLRYECRDGVFKTLCRRAIERPRRIARETEAVSLEGVNFWKMSLGDARTEGDVYEECIREGFVALGWGGRVDYRGADTLDSVQKREAAAYEPSTPYSAQALHRFKNEIEEGDLVVVSEGLDRFRAIGRVTGQYYFVDRPDYAHRRAVEWLYVPAASLPREDILTVRFSQASIYRLAPSKLVLPSLRALLAGSPPIESDNYVLIIDEINRGNIAKILGELITLLEPDKRLGASDEVQVTLPYSGESFGVPANVFVIGTMNTADRSIAFLDTALRRRFRFVECMPDAGVLRAVVGDDVDGVDVAALLDTMNARIEVLYDRDHTLGHAYLLKVESLEDLRDVFVDRLIPLLREYFYNDDEKVAAVLGCHPTSNPSWPILVSADLGGIRLDGIDLFERPIRYSVNPAFLGGAGTDLASFFQGVE